MTTSATTSSSDTICAHCGVKSDESLLIEVHRYPVCPECLQSLSRRVGRSGRRRSTPQMRKRRLGKVVVGREVAGVCGGLADYCNMERGTFRALTVVGACVTAIFPFVIAYLVLAFVLPVRDDER